jgi:hypothetical protein
LGGCARTRGWYGNPLGLRNLGFGINARRVRRIE